MNQTLYTVMPRAMASTPDRTRTYDLTCADCSFETRFEGDLDALYAVIEDHQDEMSSHPSNHFVEFEALGT